MGQGTFGPGDICSQDNFVQIAHCCAISWRLSMREIFDIAGQATKKERVAVGKRRGIEKGAKKIGGKAFCFFSHERKGFFLFLF